MKKEQVKEFVKNHKKEILAGALTAVVGGCMYGIGKRVGLQGYIEKETKLIGGSVACPGFCITEDLTIGDLGKLGEAFLKHDLELTETTRVLGVGSFQFE